MQKAGEAVSHAMSTNKKVSDMKSDIREPTTSDRLASDFGVKNGNTDVWLSASTEEYKGPALLEDNFSREKVWLSPLLLLNYKISWHVGFDRSQLLPLNVFFKDFPTLQTAHSMEFCHFDRNFFLLYPSSLMLGAFKYPIAKYEDKFQKALYDGFLRYSRIAHSEFTALNY